jgi:hypothetical protein
MNGVTYCSVPRMTQENSGQQKERFFSRYIGYIRSVVVGHTIVKLYVMLAYLEISKVPFY